MLLLRYVAWLFFPLSVCLGLLVVGLLVLWFGRRQTLGKALVTLGTALLVLFSWGPFADSLLRPDESAYPALMEPPTPAGEGPVRWVVVLGAGYRPDPAVPVTARIGPAGLVRLAEGVRVRRGLPGAKLLVMIGGADPGDGRVEAATELATALGVPADAVVVEPRAKDTAAEADAIRREVGSERFVLVTSAAHMPRAVRLCEDRGLRPIPAPTDYQAAASEYGVLHALPSPSNLSRTEIVFYEALARAWRSVGG